jgi:hypothetical protein
MEEGKALQEGSKETNRQMLPHLLRDRTQPDGRKVVDREPRVLRVVDREHVLVRALHGRLPEPRRQLLDSQLLRHLLQEDLDKDSARTRRLLLVHVNDVEDAPGDAVRREEVAEEAADVPEPVRLVSVNGLVVVGKSELEGFAPDPVDLAEALADKAVERGVGSFLRATLDDHVGELDLKMNGENHKRRESVSTKTIHARKMNTTYLHAFLYLDLHELVDGFLVRELSERGKDQG